MKRFQRNYTKLAFTAVSHFWKQYELKKKIHIIPTLFDKSLKFKGKG